MQLGSRTYAGDWSKNGFQSTTKFSQVRQPGQTVEFTYTATLINAGGKVTVIEESEAYAPKSGGWDLSPSLHFRHSTRCNVVWVDSHVSSEKMEFSKGYSFLSLSPVECRKLYKLGWMGQDNNNLFDLK